jgi:hypothetical protein
MIGAAGSAGCIAARHALKPSDQNSRATPHYCSRTSLEPELPREPSEVDLLPHAVARPPCNAQNDGLRLVSTPIGIIEFSGMKLPTSWIGAFGSLAVQTANV